MTSSSPAATAGVVPDQSAPNAGEAQTHPASAGDAADLLARIAYADRAIASLQRIRDGLAVELAVLCETIG